MYEFVLKEMDKNFNDNFVSFVYEDYVKEEIDIVAFDEKNIAFIECKWTNKSVGLSVLNRLKEKSMLVNSSSLKKYFILFSKSGFSNSLRSNEVRCF